MRCRSNPEAVMSHTPEALMRPMSRRAPAPALVIAALLLMALNSAAHAICKPGHMINPVSDVAWQCIFPISIMGIPFDGGNHPPDNDTTDVFCDCPGKD